MTRLTIEEIAFIRRTPVTDFVTREGKNTLGGTASCPLHIVGRLRSLGLISVKLDWDRSTRELVCRTINLTEAGLAALKVLP